MKPKKNEHGYALLMVIMLVLLFTTLGMGLLAMNINASKQFNTKEEQVKARHQAEMGVLHYQSLLEKVVKDNANNLTCTKVEPLLINVNNSNASKTKYEVEPNSDTSSSCVQKGESFEVHMRSTSISRLDKEKSVDAIFYIDNVGDTITGGTGSQPPKPVVPEKPVTNGGKKTTWDKDCDTQGNKKCKDSYEVIPEFTEIDLLPMKQNNLHFKDQLVLNKLNVDGGNGAVLKVDQNMYVNNEIFSKTHACVAVGKNLFVKNSIISTNKLSIIVYWDAYLPKNLVAGNHHNKIYIYGDLYIPADFQSPYKDKKIHEVYVKGNVYKVKSDNSIVKIENPFYSLNKNIATQVSKESCATSGLEKPDNSTITPAIPFWDMVEDPSINYN